MERVFPLKDSKFDYITCEQTNYIIAYKILNDIVNQIFEGTEGRDSAIIDGNRFIHLISQTSFILKKDVKEAIEFTKKVRNDRQILPQKFRKESYSRIKNLGNYVRRTPVNFIIVGYPDENLIRIGRILAKKLNYIHVHPNKIVNKEIYNRTPIGLWIYENIKNGKKIPMDVIELLFNKEMCRKVYKDHGYVISGFPIIPNCEADDTLLPQSSESNISINIDELPHHLKKEYSVLETDDDVDSESSLDFSEEDDNEDDSECDMEDILLKKTFIATENEKSTSSFEEEELEDELYFSGIEDCDDQEYPQSMDETIYNFAKNIQFEKPNDNNEALKYNYQYQINIIKKLFREPTIVIYVTNDEYVEHNIKPQIDENNKGLLNLQNVLGIIDVFIAKFNKEFVWVFDSRMRPELISTYLDNRLEYLLRKQYHIPEVIFPNCSIPKYFRKYLNNDPYHNYEVLQKTNCVAPRFNWFQNTKSYYCPVKAYEGKLVIGRVQYSVRFLGRIYVCSSNESLQKFRKHPEKYVFYNPNCRIAIVAPTKFGKTITSYFFKEYFKADRYDCKKIALQIGVASEDKFSEAFKFAVNETNIITDIRVQYYKKMKEDKINESINVPITILTNIINNVNHLINSDDGIFCDFEYAKNILKDETVLKLIFPPECFEEKVEMLFSNPITKLLLEEKLNDIYFRELVINKELYHSFIKWLLINKHKKIEEIKENDDKIYCQWILDGPPVDLKFWKALAKRKALPDVVMLPKNITLEKLEYVYSNYHNVRFDQIQSTIQEIKIHNPDFIEFDWTKIESNLIYCKNKKDDVYIRKWGKFIAAAKYDRLQEYQFKINLLKEFLISHSINIIEVDYAEHELNKIILRIFCAYFTHTKPKILTKKDIQNIVTKQYVLDPKRDIEYDIEENSLNEESAEEEQEEEIMNECEDSDSDVNNEKDDLIISEFNLCNTGIYCPVCVIDSKFLIKGLLKFCCSYQNRIFVFSSKLCLHKFILAPEYYFSDFEPPEVPLVKICLLGPNYVSKMHLAHRLSEKFNVPLRATHFFSSDKKIECMFGESPDEYDDTASLNSLPNDLEMSNINGLVITGYPGNNDHFEIMLKHNFIPEIVFIMHDYKATLEALENYYFNQYKQKQYSIEFVEKISTLDNRISLQDPEAIKTYIRGKSELITKEYEEQIKILVKNFKKINIPVIQVGHDLNPDSLAFEKMCDRINNNRDRNALFDTVRVISMEVAKTLIKNGIHLMSRFQRSCPVQISEINCLCNYEGMLKQNKVFPCIYRQKIYFISGKESLALFLRNPRKYVETCNPFQLSTPLKVLIMGPPKSGVSSLSRRISKEYGMKIFTENDIREYILTEMKETRICKEMIKHKKLTPYIFSKCIRIIVSSASTGIILDNFPVTANLLIETMEFGVDIQVTFLIQMKFEQCCEILKRKCPNQGLSEIAQGYENYYKRIEAFNLKYFNFFHIQKIYAIKNQWETWDIIKFSLIKTARTLIAYGLQIKQDRASHIYRLNAYNEELFEKLDDPPLLCCVCLKHGCQIAYRYDWANVGERFYTPECQLELIKPNGYRKQWLYDVYRFPKPYAFNDIVEPITTDTNFGKNFMQLRNKFYWICDDHTIEFLLNRYKYIPIEKRLKPIYIALLVLNYPKLFVANDGYCIVSYDKSIKLTGKKILDVNVIDYLSKVSIVDNVDGASPILQTDQYIEGNRDLAIYYRGKIFLCANKPCCVQFLSNPEYFYHIKFKPFVEDESATDEPDAKLYFGSIRPEILIKGLVSLNALRPKHYALTTEQSAATYLGLYLKTYVVGSKSKKFLFYKNLIETFIKECNIVLTKIKTYKMEPNPFIAVTGDDFEFGNSMNQPENNNIESLLNKFKCRCTDTTVTSECGKRKI